MFEGHWIFTSGAFPSNDPRLDLWERRTILTETKSSVSCHVQSHSHSCLQFLTSSRAHLLTSPLFLPSSLGTDGSSLSFQVYYLVILGNIFFFFCSVNPYHPSLQFGHFIFHVMLTHDVYDSKTCQLWVCVDYITSIHCAELIAVCSMMVGGGVLKQCVCV